MVAPDSTNDPSPAPATPGRSHLPPMPRRLVPVVVGAVLLVASALTWALFWELDSFEHLTNAEHASERLDAVKIGLTVAGGLGAMFALWLSVRRQRAAERDSEDRYAAQLATERDATERRITELYGRAVDQLGSDKAAVRLGGLYSLERLGQDHRQFRQTVVNVLCAYLRMRYELRDTAGFSLLEKQAYWDHFGQERQVRLAAQRILHDHLRESLGLVHTDTQPNPNYWGVLEVDLSSATLIDFNLHNARLKSANFERARFIGRPLEMRGVIVEDVANFTEAEFQSRALFFAFQSQSFAWFHGAKFEDEAVFEGAEFGSSVKFDGTIFSKTASFCDARFGFATSFEGADFQGVALFCRARFDTGPMLNEATFRVRPDFSEATANVHAIHIPVMPEGWAFQEKVWNVEGKPERVVQFVRQDSGELPQSSDENP